MYRYNEKHYEHVSTASCFYEWLSAYPFHSFFVMNKFSRKTVRKAYGLTESCTEPVEIYPLPLPASLVICTDSTHVLVAYFELVFIDVLHFQFFNRLIKR